MRTSYMVIPLLLVAVAGCSKEDSAKEAVAADAAASNATSEATADSISSGKADEAAPPSIGARVAPGVAFEYRYNFGLPADNIPAAQEAHAALCERMGIVHCRVTGMHYNKAGDGQLEASLNFKLDPAMAHSFTREATDAVEKADGKLIDSLINGEDAGSGIVANDRNATQINAELAKIDAQLKIPGLSKEVRSRLVEEAGDLRAQLRELGDERGAKVESLATTPVNFDYSANEAIFGFDNRSPVQQALRTSGGSFTTMLSFLIIAIGALAPWAMLGGAIFWLVRRLRVKKVVDAAGE
jgi:Domain of unknown function (DUF4349)